MSESNYKKNVLGPIKDWINKNPGTALGIAIGLVLGILLFTLGVFKTILLLAFMAFGYWLGRNKDKNVPLSKMISKIFRHDD